MTVAASFEQAGHYPLGVRGGGSHLRRVAIVLCTRALQQAHANATAISTEGAR